MLSLLIFDFSFLKTNIIRKNFIKICISAIIFIKLKKVEIYKNIIVKIQSDYIANVFKFFLYNKKFKQVFIN